MIKVRKDWIFFIGITPMLLNSLFPLVGYKPVVLIALAISLFYASISSVSQPKLIRRVLLASIMLIITVAGYIYSAVLIHGHSMYITVIYAQAFYVLPIAIITLAYVIDFKRANTFFLVFIAATVLQHVIFGFQGHYVSHHMSDGMSQFPGITGHYHNSFIASFALILAAEIVNRVSDKVNIKNMILLAFVFILCGMPVFGAARGAILTNLIAILVFLLAKLNRIRSQSTLQIFVAIIFLVMLIYFVGGRINSLVAQQNTYGYSGVTDVLNITEYRTEKNYTGRVDWWQEEIKHTLSVSPLFGNFLTNIPNTKFSLGSMSGSAMHSYFAGTLQDGGILLFILIIYLFLYPIIVAFKRGMIRENIIKIIWLIAIGGAIATNTWMYGGTAGPIYAYLYAYATISIIKNSTACCKQF